MKSRDVVIKKNSWSTITEDGVELDAVFRIQEAANSKKCSKVDCPLGIKIQPMQDYARIYYRESDTVEMMHKGCFYLEFPDARNR